MEERNGYNEEILSAQLWLKPVSGISASRGGGTNLKHHMAFSRHSLFSCPFPAFQSSKEIVFAAILTLKE